MTRLNQIVAIEAGEKARANKATAPLFHAAKNPALFAGFTKTYEPIDEDGEQFPDDNLRVQFTVQQITDEFVKHSSRMIDLSATKELTNMNAVADVIVGGNTLIEQAPVTFLLPFEKYLTQEVRGLVESLPTLDPAQNWSNANAERHGISETEELKRAKSKKVQEPLVLAPATDKHPAQVQLITRDILAGYWTEKKFSGAISASRKQELLDRVEELIQAVKKAREQANSIDVADLKVADAVFSHLFA